MVRGRHRPAPGLLEPGAVSISRRIRHRLVTVILLGVITSALSLVALVRVISSTTGQRVERGRAGVEAELSALLASPPSPPGPPRRDSFPRPALVGLRAGWAPRGGPDGPERTDAEGSGETPDEWQAAIRAAVEEASRPSPSRASPRVIREAQLPGGVLVVAAAAAAGPAARGIAWAAYLVPPPTWLRTWQIIVVALTLATALLVTSAVAAVITVKRGAAALNQALDGLATDLTTPVPRPRLRELSDVADGIARLAHRLTRSRELQDDMGRELAMKDRLAALGRVAAGVAHEVRNPLASIKLRLDLAVSGAGPRLPPVVVEAIAHASGEIARLDRLVADLLVVASPGIGPPVSTEIGALVRTRVEALAPWTAVRGVAVQVEGQALASVDVDALARAIDNLVRNAVEASPPDGRVHIAVGLRGDAATIRVEDHGAGVPAARVPELFEPFFTTKPNGTGLGLAICRSIARAHGGDVTFTRRQNDATTCVELTVARWSSARAGAAAAAAAAAGREAAVVVDGSGDAASGFGTPAA